MLVHYEHFFQNQSPVEDIPGIHFLRSKVVLPGPLKPGYSTQSFQPPAKKQTENCWRGGQVQLFELHFLSPSIKETILFPFLVLLKKPKRHVYASGNTSITVQFCLKIFYWCCKSKNKCLGLQMARMEID